MQIVGFCKEKLGDCLKVLDTTLASQQGDYILGDMFSAADIMLGQGLKNSLVGAHHISYWLLP